MCVLETQKIEGKKKQTKKSPTKSKIKHLVVMRERSTLEQRTNPIQMRKYKRNERTNQMKINNIHTHTHTRTRQRFQSDASTYTRTIELANDFSFGFGHTRTYTQVCAQNHAIAEHKCNQHMYACVCAASERNWNSWYWIVVVVHV